MRMRSLLPATLVFAAVTAGGTAQAGPYIVIEDPADIAVTDQTPNINGWRKALITQYAATGFPLPEVLSVWTAFPMNGQNFGTYIDPRMNDVKGIGLEGAFIPKVSSDPPLRAVLWHNNVLAMQDRADLHRAPLEGYAQYLFLLELSHLWGPGVAVPAPNPNELIGFPFHWSFFNDVAGPAGGNAWTDNGDGTFTVVPGAPSTTKYSNLDLYILGLAESTEVQPFGVLEPTDVPATPTDPFWGGAYAAHSFPWFDTQNPPLTVTATRRELTIDDVIAANGTRDPAANVKTSWTLGIVLIVEAGASDADIAVAKAAFDPIAESLAPAFSTATQGRGTLEVVTVGEGGAGGAGGGAGGTGGVGAGGAGGGTGNAGANAPAANGGESDDGCSCAVVGGGETDAGSWRLAAAIAAVAAWVRRRRG